jgi:uncharacterized protein YndB with AHSA1/START domain
MSESHAIVVEKVLPYTPERIWRTLTQSDRIAKWLMPNDFEAAVGHRFTFCTKPMGDWDGIVHCEVLQCAPRVCCAIPGRVVRIPIRLTDRGSIQK